MEDPSIHVSLTAITAIQHLLVGIYQLLFDRLSQLAASYLNVETFKRILIAIWTENCYDGLPMVCQTILKHPDSWPVLLVALFIPQLAWLTIQTTAFVLSSIVSKSADLED